jgi:biopolymer transport protein ExbD/biopolymer transport protein TolR
MAMARRNEGSKVNSDINVTPMVDVMLVLLIIFMVVIPMLQFRGGVPVTMAKTEHPVTMTDADRDAAIVVAVARDGVVYLGSDRVAVDQLNAKVTDRLQRANDKRVFVRADGRASYGAVADVVNQLRAAHVEELGLLTEQSRRMLAPSSDPARKMGLKT